MPVRALLYRRPPDPQAIEICFDQAIFQVQLRRHVQARRYTLRIHAARREAVLTMPPRASLREAKAFAEKYGGWIAARLGRLPKATPFAPGETIPLRGEPHRIVHRRGMRGTVWTDIEGDERLMCVAGELPHLARRVGDFLRREARHDLEAAGRKYCAALGVAARRITVRDQASRWGSCSTAGMLSFSWRLILAPTYVLDYLAAHEVVHLVEMNHSSRFWRLVERICPDMPRAKAWLDAHGTELHRYGTTDSALANNAGRRPIMDDSDL